MRRPRKLILLLDAHVITHHLLAQPLNLANSPSLHLLTPAEQTLCSQLRILPKPYLVIKETLVREYARRGGKLRRREARDLVKIDVNKTSRVWDFLVQSGYLKITTEPSAAAAPTITPSASQSQSQDTRCVLFFVINRAVFLILYTAALPFWLSMAHHKKMLRPRYRPSSLLWLLLCHLRLAVKMDRRTPHHYNPYHTHGRLQAINPPRSLLRSLLPLYAFILYIDAPLV